MDDIRGLMRRVWVLSASGPVSFCQLAGSPASHGRLYVARAVHCQVRPVSTAQLLSVGCSCRNCPATAGVDIAQLSNSAGVPATLQLFAAAAAAHLFSPQLLASAGSLSAHLLPLRWAPGSPALSSLTSSAEPPAKPLSPPLAPVVGKGPCLTSLGSACLPLGPVGLFTSW